MKKTPKFIFMSVLAILFIAFTVVAVNFSGEFFKGQLALNREGVDVFPASADKGVYPVFSLCAANENCSKKITVKFLLENGKYVNQLSLENAAITNRQGRSMLVRLVEDKSQNVKILKSGDKKELNVKPGPGVLNIAARDAVYIKETTGMSFTVPDNGEFDLFDNGYFFKAPSASEETHVIKVATYELKSADGKSKILTAVPEFYIENTGEQEFTQFNLDIADSTSTTIAKRLGTNKASYYLIITSVYIAPDFLRTPSYTASGMAYRLSGGMAPKYGLHLEKIYEKCAALDSLYSASKCWEDRATKDALSYTMAHELTHVYQIEKGVNDKVKSDVTYLEAVAELNALTMDGFDWSKINEKYSTTQNCKSQTDVYKKGMCMMQYFKNEINETNIKNFFSLKKNYDFNRDFCGSWWGVMQEVAGKDLNNLKADFDARICI